MTYEELKPFEEKAKADLLAAEASLLALRNAYNRVAHSDSPEPVKLQALKSAEAANAAKVNTARALSHLKKC